MELHIECVMCGKEKVIPLPLDTIDPHRSLQYLIDDMAPGWVTQLNGNNFDTYCSKKCANGMPVSRPAAREQ